jgi:hypothetical protein
LAKRSLSHFFKEKIDGSHNKIRKIDHDLNGFKGWMDKKIDFKWIRSDLFSYLLCVDDTRASCAT